MTLGEFKAWFEGFTEGFDGRSPTKAQWARICKRVKEINDTPTSQHHYYHDYYWPYRRYYTSQLWNGYAASNIATSGGTNYLTTTVPNTAMADLGRAEFRAIDGAVS